MFRFDLKGAPSIKIMNLSIFYCISHQKIKI